MNETLVIGGGILGAMTAWHLAGAGQAVTLVAPDGDADMASAGSLAWLNVSSTVDPVYAGLRARSLALWQGIAERHPDCPVDFRGALFWQVDPAAAPALAARMHGLGEPAELWDARRIAAALPELRAVPDSAAFLPAEGAADPARITAWALGKAVSAGVRTEVGRVTGLTPGWQARLQDGRSLYAERVVLAAGLAAVPLLAPLGIDLPLQASPALLLETDPAPPVAPHVMVSPHLDFWQHRDGRLLIASSLAKTTSDAAHMAEADSLARMQALFPALEGLRAARTIRRDRPIPADGLPLVGPVVGQAGLWVAASHSGMTLAPAIAAMLAGMTSGWSDPADATWSPDRAMGSAA